MVAMHVRDHIEEVVRVVSTETPEPGTAARARRGLARPQLRASPFRDPQRGDTPPLRDGLIRDSWRRCVATHGLDPTRLQEARILPEARVREHRERLEDLIRTARFGLESLHRRIAGQGYVLLLSDARGVTVDFMGDPTFDNHLRRAGLYLGSDWNEAHAGTCGVGLCIASGEALTVHQTDHFDATHVGLTCTCAPIHDVDGRLAAVLDISALRSPTPKDSQHLALQLVQDYAHTIEMANLERRFRDRWLVRFSLSPDFVEADPDCAVALDDDGRILGMTDRARRLLAGQSDGSARDPSAVIGRHFNELVDFDVERLGELGRGAATESCGIEVRSGRMLYAHAAPPGPAPAARSRPDALRRGTHGLPAPLAALTGGDPAILAMLGRAARLVEAPVAIMIRGETGTGKEYLAKALHQSRRKPGPFVAVNCAALPESLIESELFGHVPGAFTGARARGHAGLIREASGGTLFLDEIGDMPLALQGRLLRVLAEREVLPVGGARPVPVDIRVISASHRDLMAEVRAGRFREDLYYRLNGALLTLPPLRERADLDWLVGRMLADGAADPAGHRLDPQARLRLRAHHWPGNLRELANALVCARAVSTGGVIRVTDLPEDLQAPALSAQAHAIGPHPRAREDAEMLRMVLKSHRWNVSAAARALGIDRTTVHRRMRRLGIRPPHRVEG